MPILAEEVVRLEDEVVGNMDLHATNMETHYRHPAHLVREARIREAASEVEEGRTDLEVDMQDGVDLDPDEAEVEWDLALEHQQQQERLQVREVPRQATQMTTIPCRT